MTQLEAFRNFTLGKDGSETQELVALSAFGRAFQAECGHHGIPVPDYIETNMLALKKEISSRVADQRANRRKQIERELAGLESADDKRKRLIAERDQIVQAESGQ